MSCKRCGEVARSDPAGFSTVATAFVKRVGSVSDSFLKKAPKPSAIGTGGSYQIGGKTISNIGRSVPDPIHSGNVFGSVRPTVQSATGGIDTFKANLDSIVRANARNSKIRIQELAKTPVVHPKVQGAPDTDVLALLRNRSSQIADSPVLVTPEKIARSGVPLRTSEAAARLQGTALQTRKLADDLSAKLKGGANLTDADRNVVSAAMRELDDAGARFLREPTYDPRVLARQVKANIDTVFRDTDADYVARTLAREAQEAAESGARTTTRTGVGRVDDALGAGTRQFDDLAGAGTRQFDDLAGAGTRNLAGAADDIAGKGASVYKNIALVGGAAIGGGLAVKMLMGDPTAIPLGEDLVAYQEAVCTQGSQYYDETACAMITAVNDLLKRYPESWEDVCVEGSAIYDAQMCQVVQGMTAAATAGVPYQGGGPEQYGGTDNSINQAKINELVSTYCHPASPSYDESACEQVKALAAKYGFSVAIPGSDGEGNAPAQEPPWDQLTIEEIQAIVCDRYGNWYDTALCAEYTEYIKQQYAPIDGTEPYRDGDVAGGYYDDDYLPGSGNYPGAGGFADGGWYGGSGGGVIYDENVAAVSLCALEDPVCVGWFEYLGEMFYWDGNEFYDTYGNLVRFVWTDEDQAEYEATLAQAVPDGGMDLY